MEPTVLRLLEVLVRAEGKVVTKVELLDQVWGGRAVVDNVITVAMTRLRKVLGHTSGQRELVNNVHGRGYRLVCPVVQQPSASSRRAPFRVGSRSWGANACWPTWPARSPMRMPATVTLAC